MLCNTGAPEGTLPETHCQCAKRGTFLVKYFFVSKTKSTLRAKIHLSQSARNICHKKHWDEPQSFLEVHCNSVGVLPKTTRQLRCRHKKGIRSFKADRCCVIRRNVFFFILFITLVTSKTLIFSSTSTSCRHWSQVVVVSSGLLQLEL